MLGKLDTTNRTVTVIGAGFAGLATAWHLLQNGYAVSVYESAARPGGLVATQQTPYGMAELAAHSVRTNVEIESLCQQLRVPLMYAQTKKKYIWRNGCLRRWPLGLMETARTIVNAITRRSAGTSLTLADWGAQHLGPAAVDNILAPMAAGIYGSDPQHLLANLAFSTLDIPPGHTLLGHMWGKRKGNGHKSRMAAPARGMQQLIDALAHAVRNHPNGSLQFSAPATTLPDGNVIIATSAGAAADLLPDTALADALRAITYVPLVTATVFVNKSDHASPDGVGALYSADAPLHGLGVLFNSRTFAGRSTTGTDSFTVMLGGRKNSALVSTDDETLRQLITEDLQQVIGLRATPRHIHITRWPQAIPEYNEALGRLLHTPFDWLTKPGHMLQGNYTGAVSLRVMTADIATLAV